MIKMKQLLVRLWHDDSGQDLIEYSLLVVLLALAAVAAVGKLGNAVNKVFSNANVNLTTPT